MNNNKTKILITGASGYIGSNLISNLLNEQNHELFLVVKQKTGEHQKCSVIEADLSKKDFHSLLPKEIDIVIHLAQSKLYRDSENGAADMFAVNVNSTFQLLEWAKKNRIKKFIYFSTGNVYKQTNKLFDENDRLEATSFYGSSKIMAEELCKNYCDFFQTIIIRPFNVYGPGQKGMMVQNIADKIINKQLISLASGVGIWITPVFINDCIEYIIRLINFDLDKKLLILNLSGNEKINLRQLGEIISKNVNEKPYYEENSSQPAYLMGDNSKIKTLLSYSPKITLENGIIKTLSSD